MRMLKALINGSAGRMGKALLELAPEAGVKVVAGVDVGDDLKPVIGTCDVVIDFSFHKATLPVCRLAAEHTKPVVIGTTGHTPKEREEIAELALRIPICLSGNYSIGVNTLFYLTRRAAQILGRAYDAEIVELHHRHKKDAPSGTAENLASLLRESLHIPEDGLRHGRSGIVGERTGDEIGMHAVRGGEVVGEHTVFFFGPHDRIELTHRAGDRRIFASGAFRAAQWLVRQPPGLYDMRDVLGLKDEEAADDRPN